MNEAETRAQYIDPALAAVGWGVVPGSRIRTEYIITPGRLEGHGRRAKPLIADYILEYRNHKLAVIEAKAFNEPLTLGLGQAKNYAGKMAIRYAYAANGQGVYAVDMHTGREGNVPAFPSPDELWSMTFAQPDVWRDRFAAVPFEDKGGTHPGRYFQDIAVERVMEAVADGRKRILLTLATGTGKTFIAFQIAWKLFKSRWNLSGQPSRQPRILFLADRNVLAGQAYNKFSSFEEEARVRILPDEIRNMGRVPRNGSIFFTIFQTFMTGEDENGNPAPYFGQYPPNFFDFIIIDECHRGGANDESNWRGILEYFAPAVQLGLTATPKRHENADTYAYFGKPVFIYSLREGINDGFLTPFKVKQFTTELDEYQFEPDDTLVSGEIEPGRLYTEGDFNRTIEIQEREAHRVALFMNQIDQSEKTLVFCANQAHALLVRDLINQIKTSSDPNYCHRVTANDGTLGEQFLRDFQDNEKTIPTILTTSQKLSTGVDALNIRNIVLMRPIRSIIEFKQIIGRGTRLFDGKDYFTIYDFVRAHAHFKDPEWDGEPLEPEPVDPRDPPPRPPGIAETSGEPYAPEPRPERIIVKLADGKIRSIQHSQTTTFWHPNGTPISAQEFMELLYGRLPDFFANEDELRSIWSEPNTRKQLLLGLEEKGFPRSQLAEMQKIIDAENSDLFDVLAYIAYASPPISRAERAAMAKAKIEKQFASKQKAFLDFVLSHYISVGVDELDQEKLAPLLRIRYQNSLADAKLDLGEPADIARMFSGFQRFLYEQSS